MQKNSGSREIWIFMGKTHDVSLGKLIYYRENQVFYGETKNSALTSVQCGLFSEKMRRLHQTKSETMVG